MVMPSAPTAVRPLPERLAIAIVTVALVVAPLALGCSSAQTRFALETALGAAVALWLYARPARTRLRWAPLCVCAALLIQQIPLPDRILVNVAPVSAGAWKLAHAANPSSWGTISVHPTASLAATSRILLLTVTLAMIVDLGRYRSHRLILLVGLAVSAVSIVGVGLWFGSARQTRVLLGMFDISGPFHKAQDPTLLTEQTAGLGWPEELKVEDRRYILENRGIGDGFGSFRYSNHFAGATVLTVPIAVALWLWVTATRLPFWFRSSIAGMLFGLGLWAVGGMAQSRAGAASLLTSAFVFLFLILSLPWLRRVAGYVALAYFSLIVAILIVMLGAWQWIVPILSPAWQNRFSFLLSDGRALAAQVALRMFRASPWLGTGLTSFEQIFPRFDSGHTRLYFAHNDYAQILAETGLVGVVAIVILAVSLWRRFQRFSAGAKEGYRLLNSGPWAALAGIAVHSAFDWDMYLPANAFLCCVVLGLCLGSVPSRSLPLREGGLSWVDYASRLLLAGAVAVSYAIVTRDFISEATRRRLGEAMIADRRDTSTVAAPAVEAQLLEAIADGESISAIDPGNASLAVALSQGYLRLAGRQFEQAAKKRFLQQSDFWGRKARSLNATCPGIPEPISRR
jgi:hypothetical protein